MTASPLAPSGPLIPMPEKTPAALRVAVGRLDATAVTKFDAHWETVMGQARDEYSILPARHFTEHWWTWVAVTRWPARAARFRELEKIAAESADRSERRAAAAELGRILAEAGATAA
ncbi:DUF6247 family protein [Streptomyces sp. NBC_00996]|uniref:DUF6247 family protein n=1 Tax=Streptomyces sp. NBC_00996 TaxID=2903710 RepID=UPI0038697217|nr:DUF6247 family protein [Streptomyces sp. NBC_00996]